MNIIGLNDENMESGINAERSEKQSSQPLVYLDWILRPKEQSCPYESSEWMPHLQNLILNSELLSPPNAGIKGMGHHLLALLFF